MDQHPQEPKEHLRITTKKINKAGKKEGQAGGDECKIGGACSLPPLSPPPPPISPPPSLWSSFFLGGLIFQVLVSFFLSLGAYRLFPSRSPHGTAVVIPPSVYIPSLPPPPSRLPSRLPPLPTCRTMSLVLGLFAERAAFSQLGLAPGGRAQDRVASAAQDDRLWE